MVANAKLRQFASYNSSMSAREELVNLIPSVLWTTILGAPVFFFCVHHVPLNSIYWFTAVGVASMFLPRAALKRLAISTDVTLYRRLGVPLLIKITQDAGWLRRLAGNRETRTRRDQKSLARIVSDSWMRERFHLGLCVFCVLCSAVALAGAQFAWFFVLTLINVLYNLCPMWLQQYLRLRVARLGDRHRHSTPATI